MIPGYDDDDYDSGVDDNDDDAHADDTSLVTSLKNCL